METYFKWMLDTLLQITRGAKMKNTLYYGDNLPILREKIQDETIDLVYLDPPFNSNASYNVLFRDESGEQPQAQIEAFEDTWHWGPEAVHAFDQVLASGYTDAANLLRSMREFLNDNPMMAYLCMMAVRLIELHRVLKPTGSLYLHCDPTAGHYLKMLLDGVFGPRNFRSEIIWKRSSAHSDAKQGRKLHGHIHDVIFFYTKGAEWTWNDIYTPYDETYVGRDYGLIEEETGRQFRRGDLTAARPGGDTEYDWRVKKREGANERWSADLDDEYLNPKSDWEYKAVRPYSGRYWAYSKENMRQYAKEGRIRHTFEGMPEYKRYLDEMPGVPLQDLWTDITPIIAGTQERLGYPTQKPLALLERIISSSSNEGDVVFDPFIGGGTTAHAAQRLGRRWIGMDVTYLAIGIAQKRIKEAFPTAEFEVIGQPRDAHDAGVLAAADKYQFQWWAVSVIDARPYKGKKKGADTGIDGLIFVYASKDKTEKVIVSVKGGGVGVKDVRELIAVLKRDKAAIGVLLTLNEATKPMLKEAASEGDFTCAFGKYPKIQILTIADLFDGKRPRLPPQNAEATMKTTAKEKKVEEQAVLSL